MSRRAGETRGVSHTRHKARGCDLFPLLWRTPVHKARRGVCRCLAYQRSLDPQRIGKHKPGVMRSLVALLPTCFAFHCLLERGRRAGQPPYPLNVPGAGDTSPHPQAAFLFWCAPLPLPLYLNSLWRTKIPPARRATLHYSGGCSSCSHIVSWGVGMMPATMHPVSSCCA